MAETPVRILIPGSDPEQYLEGVLVTIPDGPAVREGVTVSDPEDPLGRAKVVDETPAEDAMGLVVRMVGLQTDALTDAQLRAAPVVVDTGLTTQTDALTDAELRAAPVVVDTGLAQPTTPADTQPVSIAATVTTAETQRIVLTDTIESTTAGANLFKAPASGKKLRLWWYSLQGRTTNSAGVLAGLRFGASGDNIHTWDLSQYGGVVSHNFRSGDSYVEGAVDEAIYLQQGSTQAVLANIDYEEVTP